MRATKKSKKLYKTELKKKIDSWDSTDYNE